MCHGSRAVPLSASQLPYLIEWITYYQIQGAHRVAICDLMSTDKCARVNPDLNPRLTTSSAIALVSGWSRHGPNLQCAVAPAGCLFWRIR